MLLFALNRRSSSSENGPIYLFYGISVARGSSFSAGTVSSYFLFPVYIDFTIYYLAAVSLQQASLQP